MSDELTIIEQRDKKIAELKRLLDRAYPWLHNPYTPSQDALLCAQFDAIRREIQVVIAHLPEQDEPPVTLPCGSCDGVGGIFAHARSCMSDFCVGNGDEHSCNGIWETCPNCAPLAAENAEGKVNIEIEIDRQEAEELYAFLRRELGR
jgi:hypothetical protein